MELTYFAARGTCDKIRLLLAEANVSYTENLITGPDYEDVKHAIEFGGLPILTDGTVRLVYPNTILRYLANKYGFAGETKEENAECDMWLEACEETLQNFWDADFMKKQAHYYSNPLRLKFVNGYLANRLAQFCQMIATRNGAPYLVGNKLSYADICVFSMLDSIHKELPVVLASFPLLFDFHQALLARPKIHNFCEGPHRH